MIHQTFSKGTSSYISEHFLTNTTRRWGPPDTQKKGPQTIMELEFTPCKVLGTLFHVLEDKYSSTAGPCSMFWRVTPNPWPNPPPVDAARRPNAAHAGRPDLIPKAWCGRCQLQCFDRASEPPPPGGVRNQHVSCPYHPTVFGLLGPGLDGGILLRLTTIHGWLHARYKLAHNGEAFAWKGGKLKL